MEDLEILQALLGTFGKTVADISKIYSGKDEAYRCGCAGKYFYRNDKSFNRIVSNLAREVRRDGIEAENTDGECKPYLNIPYGLNGKCYCLYF